MSKKIKTLIFALFAFCAFFVVNTNSYAQEDSTQDDSYEDDEGDEYDESTPDVYEDEDYVYKQNGPGDQNINLRIMVNIPMNFDESIKIGGQIGIGYNRFLTSWLAVGADVTFGYNPTIGGNMYTYIPITACITFLPVIKKIEIPITMNVGVAIENYLKNTFFPAFVARGGLGIYYRINESWSVGAESFFTYMPQWYRKTPEKNDFLNIVSASIGMKYHF